MSRPTQQPDDDFFQTLRERYTFALAQDTIDRKEAESDVLFASGGRNQWDPKAIRARKKRPVLTENRLGPSIAQVVNDGRQNKPAILCTPMDGGTEETAEYFQGRIRQIEYECDADWATDTARRQQVTCGRGWLRVTTRYKRGKRGAQEICIDPIENQFSVIWDPGARRYDLSDAKWILVIRTMTVEQHDSEFGKNTLASRYGFWLEGSDNPAPGWMGVGSGGRMVQVADYYVRDEADPDADEAEEGEGDYDSYNADDRVTIYATNGVEVLDQTEWIGSSIPVLPQWGEQEVVEGVKRSYSLIRHAKDPQKLVNLYVSNIAEQISQMPKTPYLAAEGQILGREAEWETINDVARAVIQYKTRSLSGEPVGPPTRNVNEPPIQALVTGYLQAVDAIKATMGIFDAGLGARSNETSGIAIQRRQKETDVTNFHFSDNEARTRKSLGRILLEIIPIVDGEEPAKKAVRGPDGKTKLVQINQPHFDAKTGKVVHHDMKRKGGYLPAISTGPSYTSQREQENTRQGEIIKAAPELLWVLGDLFFATSDGPGAKELAERMERAINARTPGLIDPKQSDPQQQIQQAMMQAQQLGAQNQQLMQQVQQMGEIIRTKQVEVDGKFKVEALHSWTQIKVAEISKLVQTGIADADREASRLEQMFDAAHETGMAAQAHAHDVLQAQQGHDAAADAAAQQQQHQAGMQQDAQAAAAQQQQAAQQQPQGQQAQ